MSWYCLQLAPIANCEKKVELALGHVGFEVCVPKEDVLPRRRYSKARGVLDEPEPAPLVPGYAFAKFEGENSFGLLHQKLCALRMYWYECKSGPRAFDTTRLIIRRLPLAVPQDAVSELLITGVLRTSELRRKIERAKKPHARHHYRPGDIARIIDGPYSGTVQKVTSVRRNQVEMLIQSLGGDRKAWVSTAMVEAAE